MDYLVFAIGLLLLSSAVGAGLLYREDRVKSRWPLLVIGFLVLAFCGWADLILFASGSSDSMSLIRVFSGVVACAALGGFAVRPFEAAPTSGFRGLPHSVKVCLVPLGSLVALLSGGRSDEHPVGFFVAVGLAAFAAGWEVSRLRWGRSALLKIACGLGFALVALIQVMPHVVETTFDVTGTGPRLEVLAMLSAATVSAFVIAAIIWSLRAKMAARKDHYRPGIGSRIIVAAFILTLGYGAWLAHWLGNLAQDEQKSRLLSAVRLGAETLDADKIASIQGRPEEIVQEAFRSQHTKLGKILAAFPGTRFVYVVGKRNGHLVFLCDAEDPDSKDFSPPGMIYEEQPLKWEEALLGEPHFGGPDKDAWGVWYTAIQPIVSDVDGRVVAAVGVDYPAQEWLQPFAARRLAAMVMILSVACLLLALQAFNLIANEKNHRVDVLSERLSDAMDAAELDTWEWILLTGRMTVGWRISAMLGYSDPAQVRMLLQVWRRIHPAERYQLRRLMRRTPDGTRTSEAEIRLKDRDGNYIWFMVRGRVVDLDEESGPARMTGTILNIDASYRARLEIEKQRRFALRVMESVPTGVAVVASTGTIRYANPAFATMARRSPDELKDVPLADVIAGAERLGIVGTEGRLVVSPEESVAVQAFRTELQEAGEETSSIVSLIDLTSIKATEDELKQSRVEARRLALVATRTDNAVVITDRHGRIEWVNEGFTRISGYTREEVAGRTPGSVLQKGDSDHDARRLMSERIAAGHGFETEILNHAKDGRAYLVHIECQPLLDRNGELTGFMAIERDVTRDRRSARLLEVVAALSATLLSSDSVLDDLWAGVIEQLGRAVGVDRCHLFRCHPDQQSGGTFAGHLVGWESGNPGPIHRLDLKNVPFEKGAFSRWYRVLSSGMAVAGPVSTFPPSERTVLEPQNVQSILVVPVLAGGTFWGFMGFDDCTTVRQWETWEIALIKSAAANIGLRLVAEQESDALRSARDEATRAADAAERANRAKGTFLATMSHEIRTPLNAVIGMASLLETTSLSNVQKDYAETILRSSHFLLELINDILDYSRIESGRIELERAPFDLAEVCKSAFDVVRVGSMSKPLEIICRIDPVIPACYRGDSGRIRQILVNLLSNAIKFTAKGFVSLIVTGTRISTGRSQLTFDVADSGIGIAPDSLDRLFKPFTQEDSSTTRRFGGSGLGLAISKRLAGLMDGDITVTSSPGVGSVFRVTVGLEEAPEIQSPPSRTGQWPPGWNPRILVVDDNDLNRRVLEETLATLGLKCQTVEGGFSAIRTWKENGPFDLLLTDYHMPMMDGSQLVEHLKELPGAGECRFVLLGSDNSYGPEVRALFDGVATKPIWAASLVTLLSGISPQVRTEVETMPGLEPQADPSCRLESLKILVVEDNPNNQKVVKLLLKQLGIQADIVGDGSLAVDAVQARHYDIVLMDVQMPVMDGLEATRRIRANPPPHSPHIIALTADAFQEDREAVIAAGMNAYLSKPVTLDALRGALVKAAAVLSSNPTP